ncbi:hypothetical protein M501DRAFT_997366 [Patellaria atrata CBS 101060]|uniref:Uncharacterized protein n=1 Tax=Patellaria atrata CBS 101060 TaxID=1346257 RepID=A0A9P4S4L0_9PEZI|nr:hypothetical protein M501DRAFT_997366 [Patellaria atrata CBS 101060]
MGVADGRDHHLNSYKYSCETRGVIKQIKSFSFSFIFSFIIFIFIGTPELVIGSVSSGICDCRGLIKQDRRPGYRKKAYTNVRGGDSTRPASIQATFYTVACNSNRKGIESSITDCQSSYLESIASFSLLLTLGFKGLKSGDIPIPQNPRDQRVFLFEGLKLD